MSHLLAKEYYSYHRSDVMLELAKLAHGNDYCGQSSSATLGEIEEQLNYFGVNFNSTLLDLGCGNGSITLALARKYNCRVTGVDVSEKLISLANEQAIKLNLGHQAHFIASDFTTLLEVPPRQFDFLLSIGSLYWCANLGQLLSVWRDRLKTGGTLIIFLNMQYSPLSKQEGQAIDGTTFIEAEEMLKELESANFRILNPTDNTPTYIEWLNRWCGSMEQLNFRIHQELGEERANKIITRFRTYLDLARNDKVKRIIVAASKLG